MVITARFQFSLGFLLSAIYNLKFLEDVAQSAERQKQLISQIKKINEGDFGIQEERNKPVSLRLFYKDLYMSRITTEISKYANS